MTEILPLEISEQDKLKAEQLKKTANDYFKDGDYEKATDFYTQAISFNPQVCQYFSNRSLAYYRLELYGQAIQDASDAIKVNPDFDKAYYRRATALVALGRLKEATKDLTKVIQLNPNDRLVRQKLKDCQQEYKRIEFEKAIQSDDQKSAVDQLGDIDSIVVEDSYDGPHLNELNLEFVTELLDYMKQQKKLHKKYLWQMMIQIKKYFESRPSIEDVVIPEGAKITVCGDIHGQYYDLLNLFELNGLPSETNMYLWNGDFVDRGSFSVECVITLFAFKLLYPNSVYLSRGNHEANDMNKAYGFEGEVKHKYTENTFKLYSEIFNAIPLGNLIMNRILVIHGGLFSKKGVTIDDLRKINRFQQPGQSGLMCELLWSDPQFLPGIGQSKRGVGIQFGPDITKEFCDTNNLDCIIRSHEVKHDGYEIAHEGKCITIFSAPNYCDSANNKGAYIHINPACELTYKQFTAVPHPPIGPMKYAGVYGNIHHCPVYINRNIPYFFLAPNLKATDVMGKPLNLRMSASACYMIATMIVWPQSQVTNFSIDLMITLLIYSQVRPNFSVKLLAICSFLRWFFIVPAFLVSTGYTPSTPEGVCDWIVGFADIVLTSTSLIIGAFLRLVRNPCRYEYADGDSACWFGIGDIWDDLTVVNVIFFEMLILAFMIYKIRGFAVSRVDSSGVFKKFYKETVMRLVVLFPLGMCEGAAYVVQQTPGAPVWINWVLTIAIYCRQFNPLIISVLIVCAKFNIPKSNPPSKVKTTQSRSQGLKSKKDLEEPLAVPRESVLEEKLQ
ncbi:PsbP domain-containing protein 3, chloroplastic [Terramyces sp. JEL0728]|nr:PsbP domain-containing protein 3, chloroplastic [Terramyces sp. JEL0728]